MCWGLPGFFWGYFLWIFVVLLLIFVDFVLRAFGPSGLRALGPSGLWAFGLLGLRAFGLCGFVLIFNDSC